MSDPLTAELTTYLVHARALEQLDLRLLDRGVKSARDEQVREVYRSHRAETEVHLELIEDRLRVHAGQRDPDDGRASVGALEIGFGDEAAHTSTQLAISAYAFENLEIAVYHLLGRIADKCGETETGTVIARILEEEEQAAELMAGTFDRALSAALAFGDLANGR
jgi:ferritin-like metal-binding protein YciE